MREERRHRDVELGRPDACVVHALSGVNAREQVGVALLEDPCGRELVGGRGQVDDPLPCALKGDRPSRIDDGDYVVEGGGRGETTGRDLGQGRLRRSGRREAGAGR